MDPALSPTGPLWKAAKVAFYFLCGFVGLGVAAAIAIPSLLRSKITGCESTWIASMKTLVTAEEQYKSTSGSSVYAALTQLSATSIPYVDSVLRGGKKSGYCFRLSVGRPPDERWHATASPTTPGKTGNRFGYVDQEGIIRFRIGAPATSADSAIE